MIDQLLVPTMIVAAVAGGIVVLAFEAGAFWYDLGETKRLRLQRLHPHKRAYRERPLMTVVVSAHNDAGSIKHCLDSISKNSYRKVEVVVVDHASQDATQQIVKRCIAAHPNRRVRLVARRTGYGKIAALEYAFRRHGNGQLIMVLSAATYLDKTALARAAKHFAGEPDLDILKPNEQIIPIPTIAGLLESYRALLAKRANKFMSIAGLVSDVGSAPCYRSEIFLKSHNQTGKPPHVRYAHDIIVNTLAQSSYAKLLARNYSKQVQGLRTTAGQIWRNRALAGAQKPRAWLGVVYTFCLVIISVTGPLLAAYFLYLALGLHEPTLLLLGLAGLSVFLLFSIWETEQLKPRQKAVYTFGIPVTYGLFYLLSVSRLVATLGAVIPNRAATFRHR